MILKTDRLVLRPFNFDDASDFFEISSDPQVTECLTWGPHKYMSEALDYIQIKFINNNNLFCIEDSSTKKCIGCIDIKLFPEQKKASFGYLLNKHFWNKGYMTEALTSVISYIFKYLSVNKIEASHHNLNPASGSVMIKCGMIKIGTQKESTVIKGRFAIVENYSISYNKN